MTFVNHSQKLILKKGATNVIYNTPHGKFPKTDIKKIILQFKTYMGKFAAGRAPKFGLAVLTNVFKI